MSDFPFLDLTIFLPLLGAIAIGFIPKEQTDTIRWAALGVALATFVVSLGVLVNFDAGFSDLEAGHGFQLGSNIAWIEDWGIRYITGIDGISLWMIMLTTFLVPLGVLASWNMENKVKTFFIFFLALETGMLGVFAALDMFLFYLFWEAALIPMYFLIGIWGYGRRIYAAMKFFLYTLIGSLLMLVAIVYMYFATEPNSFALTEMLGTPLALDVQRLLFLGFFASFAVKVPLVPFHTWLPDAHTEAPTAGSVMLAGVLLKMGAYGLIRFAIPLFPDAARQFVPFIIALAIIGIIYGALVAIVQRDLKRLIAYSSVAHLGFVVLGIFVGTIQGMSGGILQMVSHGLSTGALFMLVGMLSDRRHTRLIAEFGGLQKTVPILAGIFLFVLLSSIGLPGLNGFVGEFLILVGTFVGYRWWVVPAAFGVVLAAVYLLWAYRRVFHGPVTNEANRVLPDVNLREALMLAPILALILFIGVYPQPFLDRIEPAAERAVVQLRESTADPEKQAGPIFGPDGEELFSESYTDRFPAPLPSGADVPEPLGSEGGDH